MVKSNRVTDIELINEVFGPNAKITVNTMDSSVYGIVLHGLWGQPLKRLEMRKFTFLNARPLTNDSIQINVRREEL